MIKFKKCGLMYFLRTSTISRRRCKISKRKQKEVEILSASILAKRKKDMRLKSILISLTIISKKVMTLKTLSKSRYLLEILENGEAIALLVSEKKNPLNNKKETIKRRNTSTNKQERRQKQQKRLQKVPTIKVHHPLYRKVHKRRGWKERTNDWIVQE